MANINNIQVSWVAPQREAYNEKVSTPIINSITGRYVTYMDLVMFGTLTGFGFINPGTITTWEQFLRALETILNGLNTRINNLENVTPDGTTTVNLNPSNSQTIIGPTDVTAIIANPVGPTTWNVTNIGTSGNKFSKTENDDIITITPLNTASIKGNLSISKTDDSGYVILTADFTQGAANSYSTEIYATNNYVSSSSITLTYNNTILTAASTYTWKGINNLPASVNVSYPNGQNGNQIKLTASSTINIPANTISVANANASEDAKYGESITINATLPTNISLDPSSNITIDSPIQIQATVKNGSGITTWTLDNEGTENSNTQTFSYISNTGSGNNITVKPNYINNAADLQGIITSGSRIGYGQSTDYGYATYSMTFHESTSNITNVTYSTNVYATNNGVNSNSIKVTYSKSNSKLSAGNYSVSGLPSGLSSEIIGPDISIRNYGSTAVEIPAHTLTISNSNASNTWKNSEAIAVLGKSVSEVYTVNLRLNNCSEINGYTEHILSTSDTTTFTIQADEGYVLPTIDTIRSQSGTLPFDINVSDNESVLTLEVSNVRGNGTIVVTANTQTYTVNLNLTNCDEIYKNYNVNLSPNESTEFYIKADEGYVLPIAHYIYQDTFWASGHTISSSLDLRNTTVNEESVLLLAVDPPHSGNLTIVVNAIPYNCCWYVGDHKPGPGVNDGDEWHTTGRDAPFTFNDVVINPSNGDPGNMWFAFPESWYFTVKDRNNNTVDLNLASEEDDITPIRGYTIYKKYVEHSDYNWTIEFKKYWYIGNEKPTSLPESINENNDWATLATFDNTITSEVTPDANGYIWCAFPDSWSYHITNSFGEVSLGFGDESSIPGYVIYKVSWSADTWTIRFTRTN